MYSEQIMQRMAELKNAGILKGSNARGQAGTMHEGDVMRLQLTIRGGQFVDGVVVGGEIVDARFRVFGCVPAIIACDILCDLVRGLSVEETKKLIEKKTLEQKIIAEMGVMPANKIYCATLAQTALEDVLKNWRRALEREYLAKQAVKKR